MDIQKRYIEDQIRSDLQRKMVFVGGPRQVGKTTEAKRILSGTGNGYLNWDIPSDRERILQNEWPVTDLLVLDEMHKYTKWRDVLKGLYDQFHPDIQILVTGSAQLDYYRQGGDSLQGRYHYLRMHPLSIAELDSDRSGVLQDLLQLGGFPEPFFSGSETEAKRWSREYRSRLLEDDIRSLERVQDLAKMELLMLRLPSLVGSPLSINALREDLHVSHKTVENWIQIYERLYAIFRVPPFGAPSIRAVKKEQKHYHADWTLVESDASRFENLVASHLLKWVHWRIDTLGDDLELRYFRDTDGREVDFVLCNGAIPILAIECKWNDRDIDSSLKYFKTKFPDVEAWQISATGQKDYLSAEGIRIAPAVELLRTLV